MLVLGLKRSRVCTYMQITIRTEWPTGLSARLCDKTSRLSPDESVRNCRLCSSLRNTSTTSLSTPHCTYTPPQLITSMDLVTKSQFIKDLPKVELHMHLEGEPYNQSTLKTRVKANEGL